MVNEHYSEFIEETFITPIRSVLIVDDDYPTFDEVLKEQRKKRKVDGQKSWYQNPERIERVINRFRASNRPLLVDIHDGTNVKVGDEVQVAAHLHQSDLLVLDYQLDRARPGDGTRAIKIVRSLMSNNHFNLVIVHTSEALDLVFDAFRLGLLAPSENDLTDDELKAAEELIDVAEDEDEDFSQRIFESVGIEQYCHSRLRPESYLRTMVKSQEPYKYFSEQCAVKWTSEDRKTVLRYILARTERDHRKKMNVGSCAKLIWSLKPIKWIKSESVFIAFSNKTDDDDLLAELQTALNSWNPQPSRLFLAKLRAEMDEYGVVAQGQALYNKHALAHWYDRLLRESGAGRRWYIAESVSRHSEQLMSAILPRVESFAMRLIEAEVNSGEIDNICKQHFEVDLTKDDKKLQAKREHNAFVCSKKPEGWHLTTGHILRMAEDYWVCLSPACDMVPSQLSKEHIAMIGPKLLPFIAVKLCPISDGKMPKDVQSNRFIFLDLNGDVKGFCFNNPSPNNSAPQWHTLYAEKRGEFNGESFDLTILRIEFGSKRLISKKYAATVVCQLRYEYALNLMQKLGVSLTRIGLDFTG